MRRLGDDPLGRSVLLAVMAMCAAVLWVRVPLGADDGQVPLASALLVLAVLLFVSSNGPRRSDEAHDEPPGRVHGAAHRHPSPPAPPLG